MITLSLVRHAKSAYPPAVVDHDRPLNERGFRDAPEVGSELARGRPIDLAIVSTAQRAQQTWRLAAEHLPDLTVVSDPDLYLASAPQILQVIARHANGVAETPTHVAVVGHNPGLEELAFWLAKPTTGSDYDRMLTKFPTCAIAVLAIDSGTWSALPQAAGTAQLLGFTIARG